MSDLRHRALEVLPQDGSLSQIEHLRAALERVKGDDESTAYVQAALDAAIKSVLINWAIASGNVGSA